MNHKEIIKLKINSNTHKNVFYNILKEIKTSKKDQYFSFMLKTYELFIYNKNIMRNYEIQFENYFKNDYSIKSFEKFNDDVYKKILETKTNQYIHRVFSLKYKNLINEETKALISEIILLSVSKKEFQDYFGKKLAIFQSAKEINEALEQFINEYQNWNQKYLFDKIKKNDLKEGIDYDLNSNNDNIVIIEIYTYNAMRTLGSHLWCVQRDLETYDDYIEDLEFFRIVFDFNKNQSNPYSLNACVYDLEDELITVFDKKDNEYQIDTIDLEKNQLENLVFQIKEIKVNELECFFNKVSKYKSLFEYYFENEEYIDISSNYCVSVLIKNLKDFNLKINKDFLLKYNVIGTESFQGDFFTFKESEAFKNLFLSELANNATLKKTNHSMYSDAMTKFRMKPIDYISYIESKILTENYFYNSEVILGLIRDVYKHSDNKAFVFLFKNYKELVLKHLRQAPPEFFSLFYESAYNNFSCEFPIKKANKHINNLIGYNLYEELNLSSEKISLIYFETIKNHYHLLFDLKNNNNNYFEKDTLKNKKEMRLFFFYFFDMNDCNSLSKIDFKTLFEPNRQKINNENDKDKDITNRISFEHNNYNLKIMNSLIVFDFNIIYKKNDIIEIANLFNNHLNCLNNHQKIFTSIEDEYGYYSFYNKSSKNEDNLMQMKTHVVSDIRFQLNDMNFFFFKYKRPTFLFALCFYCKLFGNDFISNFDFFYDIALSTVLSHVTSSELNNMEIYCLNQLKEVNKEIKIFDLDTMNFLLKKNEDIITLSEKKHELISNDYSKIFKVESDKMLKFYSLI